MWVPGRHEDETPTTVFSNDRVREWDGTRWTTGDGPFMLPDRTLIRLDYDPDGDLANARIASGRAVVDVRNLGWMNGAVELERAEVDGLEWRQEQVERHMSRGKMYRLGGEGDRGANDVNWSLYRRASIAASSGTLWRRFR